MRSVHIKNTTDEGMKALVRISLVGDYKDLLKESITMGTINLENINTQSLFDKLKFGSKEILLDSEIESSLMLEFEDINKDFQKYATRLSIAKDFYYQAISEVFSIYYISKWKNWKLLDLDEEKLPIIFPNCLRKFIVNNYPLFEQIIQHEENYDLGALISAEPTAPITKAIYVNVRLILVDILLNKIKSGKNLTKKLFADLPPHERKLPPRFMDICIKKDNKIILSNTNTEGINFAVAVFDCINFKDIENQKLFNNRLNALLSL